MLYVKNRSWGGKERCKKTRVKSFQTVPVQDDNAFICSGSLGAGRVFRSWACFWKEDMTELSGVFNVRHGIREVLRVALRLV